MKAVKRDCFDNSLFFWYNSQMDAKYKQGVAIGSNREMEKKINVLGVELDNYQVDEAMEMVGEYMQNDLLNTIGIVTMQMLLLADEDEQWKTYLKDLDMSIIGETEILTAAGIEEDGTLYEEVEANEFIARLFWYLIQIGSRIFVLGETEDEVESLEKYLQETYPGIQVAGGAVVESLDEAGVDSLLNEINSETADVIVSGLKGTLQDRFVMDNRSKISAKIWLSLGEHPTVQNEAGIKNSWWRKLLKKNTFKRMVTKYKNEQ